MAAKTDNIFKEFQPTNGAQRIWRYMDFTKFLSLLSTENLFLCRSDLFEDTLEGSMPDANRVLRPHLYKDMDEAAQKNLFRTLEYARKGIRQWTYISCWHANDHESAAMWKLYAQTNEAIAIESTYDQLVESVSDRCYAGCVKYIDFEKEIIPESSTFFPFIHKRASFSHENEVRLIVQDFEQMTKGKGEGIDFGIQNQDSGITEPIDLKSMISKVHVSPKCASWFVSLIEDVIGKYSYSFPVVQSDLYRNPIF